MTARVAPEYPWLLPSALTADPAAGHPRRTTRDWVVDTIVFLLALGYVWVARWDARQPEPYLVGELLGPRWLLPLDVVLSLVFCGALWVRRRWPVALAVASLPLSLFSVVGVVVLVIVVFTVTVHRRFLVAAAVVVGHSLTNLVYVLLRPDSSMSYWETVLFGECFIAAVFAWGMFVRARRQLVVSFRDRAHRAETEQRLRVAQARQLERTRIAREMHDVLAHRISLLSLHAGALEFRPDAPPEEVARAAGVIRASAHQALEDLREVIGVLREEAPDAPPERPQPTLRDLSALVAESRDAGMRVTLCSGVVEPESAPPGIARSTYRIVQEGLTNARKHAPGAAVTVTVTGGPGAGVRTEIVNRESVSAPATPIPGTGTGLVGLAERASLAGGRLAHGRTDSGDYRLEAWLPWSA